MRVAQELFYQLGGMVLFFGMMFCDKRKVKLTKVTLALSVFGIWTVCLYTLGKCTIGFNYLYNIFTFMIVYFVTVSCYKKEHFKYIRNAILWVFFLNTIYVVSQGFGWDIVGFVDKGSPNLIPTGCGLFSLPAHYGIYTAIAICMFASKRPFMSILLFGFIAVSKSTAAVMAGIIGYLYLLWNRRHEVRFVIPYFTFKKKKWFVSFKKLFIPYFFLVTLILGLGGSYYIIKVDMPMGMFSTRPPAWKLMINDALKHPLWGWGLDAIRKGNLRYVKHASSDISLRAVRVEGNKFQIIEAEAKKYNLPPDMKIDTWDNTHNEYINLLYHFSVVGVVIFGILMYLLWLRLKRVKIGAELGSIIGVMLVFLVSSLTHFPFSVARLASLAPIILGMFMIHTED